MRLGSRVFENTSHRLGVNAKPANTVIFYIKHPTAEKQQINKERTEKVTVKQCRNILDLNLNFRVFVTF